jgi:hypothetical protein
MYKKTIFGRGAKSFITYKHKKGGAVCGSGAGASSNMDNYLLGLVRNVSINSKPKKKGRGAGLKFIR